MKYNRNLKCGCGGLAHIKYQRCISGMEYKISCTSCEQQVNQSCLDNAISMWKIFNEFQPFS